MGSEMCIRDSNKYKYIYGPVPSRRLGLSLGLDLVPYKVCSFDCIYCQLGHTTELTTARKEYSPIDEVIVELKNFLNQGKKVDYITLSGSGEPTLNVSFGRLIKEIKKMSGIPVVLLTNGSLFFMEQVRKGAALADVVIPTLASGIEDTFQKIHRPTKGVNLQKVVDGLIRFRENYGGKIWLEVMLIEGINTSIKELSKLKRYIGMISPDRIQLNSPVRPPSESYVTPPSFEKMMQIKEFLGPNTAIISYGKHRMQKESPIGQIEDEIVSYLSRRPGRPKDLADSLGFHINQVVKVLDKLQKNGIIRIIRMGKENYYSRN